MGINRDDMLELTRRMTPSRTCFTRVAGCYVDADGDFDGSFNIHFGKLNAHASRTWPGRRRFRLLLRMSSCVSTRSHRGKIRHRACGHC